MSGRGPTRIIPRIDHLFGTASGGLNQIQGSYKYLNASTLLDDGAG